MKACALKDIALWKALDILKDTLRAVLELHFLLLDSKLLMLTINTRCCPGPYI